MRWVVEDDLSAFLEQVRPFLDRDPVRTTVPGTVLSDRARGVLPVDDLWTAWLRGPGGGVAGLALRTPPRGLLVTALPPAAIGGLVDVAPPGLPGGAGPPPAVGGFCTAYADRHGARVRRERSERLYRLGTLVPPPVPPGGLRPMTEVALLVRWMGEFAAEAHAIADGPPDLAARLIADGRMLVWDVEGTPVSLVGLRTAVGGVVRIGPVWTPPEHRRRGYAAAAVAAACARQPPGVTLVLYADTANRTSTGVYTRLGFRPVADQEDWVLEY